MLLIYLVHSELKTIEIYEAYYKETAASQDDLHTLSIAFQNGEIVLITMERSSFLILAVSPTATLLALHPLISEKL